MANTTNKPFARIETTRSQACDFNVKLDTSDYGEAKGRASDYIPVDIANTISALQLELLCSGNVVEVWMRVPNVFDAQRTLTPRELRVHVPLLLCILIPQFKEKHRSGYHTHHSSSKSKAISTIIVWGITVDLRTNDGETLANHSHET
jgi:hypothetical protein